MAVAHSPQRWPPPPMRSGNPAMRRQRDNSAATSHRDHLPHAHDRDRYPAVDQDSRPCRHGAVPAARRRIAGRRDAAVALAARVGQTPFYAYDRQVLRARADELRRLLPGREAALRDEGQPDAGAGGLHGRPGRWHRRGLGGRAEGRARCRCRSAGDQLRRPGQTRGRVAPGGGQRRAGQHRVAARGATARRDRGRARPARARGGARQPRLRAQGLGHEDGWRAEAVRRRCRTGARADALDRRAAVSPSKASTSSPARRTCAPNRSAKRSRSPTNWRCAWPSSAPARCGS